VAEHGGDPGARLVEVDVDTTSFEEGHLAGAVGWNWTTQLCDPVVREIVAPDALERLLGESGIDNDTLIVLYGDNNNWFAAWAYWQLKLYGHARVSLMDGGRKKWLAEGRPLVKHVTSYPAARYRVAAPDLSLRAFLPEVQRALSGAQTALVDVRSPQEFTGELLAPPGLPETCQRGGHIPGAVNVPWARACREDGTFRSRSELEALYRTAGVTGDRPVITYCRIGERSSHTWFVLKYLLDFPQVKNYDGSWTEWGNLVGAPVARP
jgi:thiosulfate/3-mercaptopyruvate sulfurtransferase